MQPKLFDLPVVGKPEISDENLYVIIVMFNPRAAPGRYKLWNDFVKYAEFSGAKLICVEAAFQTRPFVCTEAGNPWHVQLRTDQDLWHKERMVNLGIQRVLQLAPHAKYIANIDADVRFSNPNWVRDAVLALHHYQVIQLFSEAQSLLPDNTREWSCPSAMKKFDEKGYHQVPEVPLRYVANGHPGLAWAYRREFLEAVGGLLDFCIGGSGDSHMANAIRGDVTYYMRDGMSPGFKRALHRWADRAHAASQFNVGYVDGVCTHYWHGAPSKRGYEKRRDIECFMQFDPHEDIYLGLNGLYNFTGSKPHLMLDLRRSMKERQDE